MKPTDYDNGPNLNPNTSIEAYEAMRREAEDFLMDRVLTTASRAMEAANQAERDNQTQGRNPHAQIGVDYCFDLNEVAALDCMGSVAHMLAQFAGEGYYRAVAVGEAQKIGVGHDPVTVMMMPYGYFSIGGSPTFHLEGTSKHHMHAGPTSNWEEHPHYGSKGDQADEAHGFFVRAITGLFAMTSITLEKAQNYGHKLPADLITSMIVATSGMVEDLFDQDPEGARKTISAMRKCQNTAGGPVEGSIPDLFIKSIIKNLEGRL